MFFIVGSARSGTTFLRTILNSHPDVAVPPESRFVVELWPGHAEVDADELLSSLQRHPRFERWELPIEAVRAELGAGTTSYAAVMEAAYAAFAHARGKRRWGDKTPRYVESIGLLAELFPQARFVHQVRDGRNVALSYADVPFGPKTVASAARLWAGRVAAGMRDGRPLGPERYSELRYEDLVSSPESEIRRLCAFLDLPFDPVMLDRSSHAGDELLPRAALYNPRAAGEVVANARAWQEQMPPHHVAIFEAVAGRVLDDLGYERGRNGPGLWGRGAAALARLGLPVGRMPTSAGAGHSAVSEARGRRG